MSGSAARRGRPATSSATSRARDALENVVDVVVADGFTGNIALKLIEGVSSQTLHAAA